MKAVVLAIGNAGGNIAETIRREGKGTPLESAHYVFADTSRDDLQRHEGEGNVTIFLRSEDDSFPQDVLIGVERLIIVAGFGGRTATKFSILAIEAAKACGVASVIIVATMPFAFEGSRRMEHAMSAANDISRIEGVSFFAFNNEDLLEKYSDLKVTAAFDLADMEMVKIILNAI